MRLLDIAVVQNSAKVDYSLALAGKCVMGLARKGGCCFGSERGRSGSQTHILSGSASLHAQVLR